MKIRVVFGAIVCGLVLALVGSARADQSDESHSRRVFKIGVLATLTGSGSSLGIDTVAALQIAEEQLQADAISQHGGYRFHFFVRDTQHDPSKALEAIKDLDRRGAQIIIGPQTSSEVAMIKPYADAHNILVISQGSTASSLAIPGDNIFRLCPDDVLEAEAIVALMLHDGFSNIVPLSTTRWYGSDGVALSAALTGDATAAAFAESVDYPNPIFGLPDSLHGEWQPISDEIEARTGIKPDAFALSTYDALFVIQRAL